MLGLFSQIRLAFSDVTCYIRLIHEWRKQNQTPGFKDDSTIDQSIGLLAACAASSFYIDFMSLVLRVCIEEWMQSQRLLLYGG